MLALALCASWGRGASKSSSHAEREEPAIPNIDTPTYRHTEYRPVTRLKWDVQNHKYEALLAAFVRELKSPIYVVGGAVRDHLLGRSQADIADVDILVGHDALAVSRRVADQLGWAYYPLDAERGFARLVLVPNHERADAAPMLHSSLVCDIATVAEGDLRVDLSSRDFTINAMAFMIDAGIPCNLADTGGFEVEIIDPHDGQLDLAQGIVREVSEHSLREDSLRLLRAVRFAAQFGFTIDPTTRARVVDQVDQIVQGSAERIRDELWKTLALPAAHDALVMLNDVELLPHLLPEAMEMIGVDQSLPHHVDVYQHTLLVVRYAALLRDWLLSRPSPGPMDGEPREWVDVFDDPVHAGWRSVLSPWREELTRHFCVPVVDKRTRAHWLVWAALFHDMGKPATRTEELQTDGTVRFRFLGHEHLSAEIARERFNALRFGRTEMNAAVQVVDSHMRPHLLDSSFAGSSVSRRACHRFFRDTGEKSDRPVGVDVVLLALADQMGIPAGLNVAVSTEEREDVLAAWRDYLAHAGELLAYAFAEDGLVQTKLNPLVNGNLLMQQLDLQPGPELGHLLGRLAEAQAAGEIATSEDALSLARSWLD